MYMLENNRILKAQRHHKCTICGREIEAGELVARDTIASCRHITHDYKCKECAVDKEHINELTME